MVAGFLLGLSHITDSDVWTHLAHGRELVATRDFPAHEPFSFPSSAMPYYNTEWLWGVLLYGAVMTGQVEYEDEDSGERLFEDGDDKALLYPFFVAETAQPSTPEKGPESSSGAPQTGSETEPGPVAASDPQVSAPSELMPAEPPGLDVAEPLPTAPARGM